MENPKSNWHQFPAPAGKQHSPRLIRSRSGTPAMPPLEIPTYNNIMRSVHRSKSTTRSRTNVEEDKKITSPSSIIIINTKSTKKKVAQEINIKDGAFVKFLQRNSGQHNSNSGGGEVLSKRITRPLARPTSPSAWALSPGRISPCSMAPTKSLISPSRIGGGSMSGVFKYFRQKKVMRVEEMEFHRFRVVHNRLLQWRFANARAEAAMATGKRVAEKKIFNVWLEMAAIRKSNMEMRIGIEKSKQEIKLYYIISSQLLLLKEWARLEGKSSEAISRVARKLWAISIKVPLVQDAKADDLVGVDDAMSMATGVIESIETLIMKFHSRAEKACYLLTELAIMAKERKEYLQELEKWILKVTSLKELEKSLRVHLLQIVKDPKQG